MKKVVPFTKTINFKTMIAEITDIEIKHTLSLKNASEIEGDILVDGKYKMTDASQIEEEFHYKLPFVIAIDSKYDTNDIEITIGDFYFEIINEEDLKLNIEINIDGILDKEELELEEIRNKNEAIEIPVEIEELTKEVDNETLDPLEQLEKEIKEDIKYKKAEYVENQPITKLTPIINHNEEKMDKNNISSIFSSIASNDEVFSTYYVYIVREKDTLESIMDKYQITREELQDYNDLSNIKLGSKLIIPCSNE